MSAVSIRNPNPRGGYPETHIESEEMNGDSFSELRTDVRNLQVHVAYLKAGVDTANTGIEFLREKLEQYRFEGVTRGEAARLETKAEFASVRAEIGALRSETTAGFKDVRAEIGALRAETTAGFKDVRAEISALRSETTAGFKDVRAEIGALRSETTAEFRAMRTEVGAEFDKVRGEISKSREYTQGRFDSLQSQIVNTQRWGLGVYLGGTAGLFFLIAHGFKWF